jgi:Fic family protein
MRTFISPIAERLAYLNYRYGFFFGRVKFINSKENQELLSKLNVEIITAGALMHLTTEKEIVEKLDRAEAAILQAEKAIQRKVQEKQFRDFLLEFGINARQKNMIEMLLQQGEKEPLTIKKYMQINCCNRFFALKDLQQLVDFGILQKDGKKNNSVFSFSYLVNYEFF